MPILTTLPIDEVLTHRFDDTIDVRSPAEFADDHLPGAINLPVLDDDERIRVGTLHAQSPFEARRLGAALIARNIARHLETRLSDKPRGWRPLVYCWRGGMRSGAMAHILAEVGWKPARLAGGYKSYRRLVLDQLQTLPGQFSWRVVCGPTGSGKSRVLQALAALGAQTLDLEQLALHRGSLLGSLPDQPQPPQKRFESALWEALRHFDPARPVYVEAESRKVGVRTVPDALLKCMREARCIAVEAPLEARVAALQEDYAHFLADPGLLASRLRLLTELHGHAILDRWCGMAENGEWPALVEALLGEHYDPAYRRSSQESFVRLGQAAPLVLKALDAASLREAASRLIAEDPR